MFKRERIIPAAEDFHRIQAAKSEIGDFLLKPDSRQSRIQGRKRWRNFRISAGCGKTARCL